MLCLTKIPAGGVLCSSCEAMLPTLDQEAPKVLFAYQPPLSQFMKSLKYHQALYFANWFAEKMIARWERPEVDCIIPVPLHPRRQQERGFNQTLEIAKVLASHWSIPLDRGSCTRIKYHSSQSTLSANQRRNNITASAFKIDPRLKQKRVLVIEDVITTGATMKAFVNALQQTGVQDVIIWACCQTQKMA